jgi:hypothetical protein
VLIESRAVLSDAPAEGGGEPGCGDAAAEKSKPAKPGKKASENGETLF